MLKEKDELFSYEVINYLTNNPKNTLEVYMRLAFNGRSTHIIFLTDDRMISDTGCDSKERIISSMQFITDYLETRWVVSQVISPELETIKDIYNDEYKIVEADDYSKVLILGGEMFFCYRVTEDDVEKDRDYLRFDETLEIARAAISSEFEEYGYKPIQYMEGLGWDKAYIDRVKSVSGYSDIAFTTEDIQELEKIIEKHSDKSIFDILHEDKVIDYVNNCVAKHINNLIVEK